MNQIEFNYETFLEGKHNLVTRGGIKIPKENFRKRNSDPYCYEYKNNGCWYSVTSNGHYNVGKSEVSYDLLMIPIQTDETIPFDLEKFKSGEWDVVDNEGDEILGHLWNKHRNELVVMFKHKMSECFVDGAYEEHISLRKKPISPFTHPELYEVSDDKEHWQDILKYYDYIDTSDWPHVFTGISGLPNKMKHLRLKQPTEISKDQAFDVVANLESVKEKLTEKFGTFKIK